MEAKSIRTFIGSLNYSESRNFYKSLGFEEIEVGPNMCLFKVNERLAFYLQDAYVKDWIENSMIFLEVEDLENFEQELIAKNLTSRFPAVKISPIKIWDWGSEIFMHDPSGVLWHFGVFNQA